MMYPTPPTCTKEPDHRFRNLLGEEAWNNLPVAIRNRFGKRLSGGASVTYQGKVTTMRLSLAGRVLANLARLIGAPLPYDLSSVGHPAVVSVTEDVASDGQFWIRQYGRAAGFPQILHSSKRFAGPTGLEEYVGYGIGMALRVQADGNALLFKSDHYFLQILGRRLRLPRALSPGALVIGHHDLGDGQFLFALTLTHRLFGCLIRQDALFHDAKE
ncbi:DUF4166 domain-containing protein [uncultured Roseovarius sp.]|uniref:DUF4166 domain-containing protein n=1 Tax=uncultured Roseovarius sp. TaxID=293344 RepID=UPI002610E6D1|nr:DUF4166 domain-containing protein [uncultured Roseovarius sp.]